MRLFCNRNEVVVTIRSDLRICQIQPKTWPEGKDPLLLSSMTVCSGYTSGTWLFNRHALEIVLHLHLKIYPQLQLLFCAGDHTVMWLHGPLKLKLSPSNLLFSSFPQPQFCCRRPERERERESLAPVQSNRKNEFLHYESEKRFVSTGQKSCRELIRFSWFWGDAEVLLWVLFCIHDDTPWTSVIQTEAHELWCCQLV